MNQDSLEMTLTKFVALKLIHKYITHQNVYGDQRADIQFIEWYSYQPLPTSCISNEMELWLFVLRRQRRIEQINKKRH